MEPFDLDAGATAWVNTTVATAGAMLGWALVERIRDCHITSLGMAPGVVAGLVAITPATAALTPTTSIVLGATAGIACALAVGVEHRLGVDDSLDVVGVHLVGGLVGTVGIGVLTADGGLLFGGGYALLAVQVLAALAAMVFSGVLTAVIAVVLAVTLGWRIPEADERAGIDLSHHAEAGYDLGGALAARRERSSRAASVPLPHPMDLEPRNPLPTGAGAGAPAAKAGHHPAATGESRWS